MVRRSKVLTVMGAVALVPRRIGSQTIPTLRVGATPSDGGTALIYAIQSGTFKKHGLDVQFQRATSGAALAAAIAGGAVDVASSSLMALINSYVHGVRFKIVAGGVTYTAGDAYLELSGLKTSGISSLADANGKRVATSSLRSLEALGSAILIDQAGGDSSTVKFIEIPAASMEANLERGAADLVAVYEPFLQAALETGKIRTLGNPYGGIGKRLVISAWFCSEAYLAQNAVAAQRFADGMREAAVYTNAHHAETAPLLAEYTHMGIDTIQKMTRMTAATSVDPAEIQPAIDAAVKYKYIDRPFSAKELLS